LDKGGFIDTSHYRGGEVMAAYLLKELGREKRFGKVDDPLPVSQAFFADLRYELTYRTSIPAEGLLEPDQKKVALGIFMDFQIRYEFFQGIDPRCYIPGLDAIIPHCSYFSNEDLVSDYLGFSSYMMNMNFETVIQILGGGTASASPPGGYHPINTKFTSFRLLENDCGDIMIIQRHLPPALLLEKPFEAGDYWDVPKFYERINLRSWY
jgi:hypothetical protein